MSPNAVSARDITDSPSFCLSGIVPLQPPKQVIDFNPVNFLDLLIFLYIYCQPLFDFNKDLLTKYNKFHAHISGDAVMENMSLCIVSWISKGKCLYFQFLFPSTFSNKTGNQSVIVISLNVCSTMNLLGLFYSKYHLLTCENYSSLPSG